MTFREFNLNKQKNYRQVQELRFTGDCTQVKRQAAPSPTAAVIQGVIVKAALQSVLDTCMTS